MSGEDLNAMARIGGQYAAIGWPLDGDHYDSCERRHQIADDDVCICHGPIVVPNSDWCENESCEECRS